MSSKETLNKRLEEASNLRSAGLYSDAENLLQAIGKDPNSHLLGPTTVHGLPRRLHSAWLKLAKTQGDKIRSTGLQYTLVPPEQTLNAFATFTLTERKQLAKMNSQRVPALLHQIWIGHKGAPAGTKAWQKYAKSNNIDYQLWDENELHALGLEQNAAYNAMLSKGDLPGAVDVARYLILERFGGIYLDCDWYPVRDDISFFDLLPMTGLIAIPENIPRQTGKGSLLLANSLIAAPPGHLVFTRLLASMEHIIELLPKAPAWWSTGPLLFTLMSRGGSVTLADAELVAGNLPPTTSLPEVISWCEQKRLDDSGLLLAWRSWSREE